jgi:hypothetical protein
LDGDDKPERVMVALDDVAWNLYHTPFVVVAVAPPHEPVGAAFVAPCKSPVICVEQSRAVVIEGAFEQLD